MTQLQTLPVPAAVIDRAQGLATKVAGIVSRIGTLKIETTEEMDMASALLVEIANERRQGVHIRRGVDGCRTLRGAVG